MINTVDFSKKAQKDLESHRKSGDKTIFKKIFELIESIKRTPYEGRAVKF